MRRAILDFAGNCYFRWMNFLRKILFPISLLYAGITALRNFFYDKGWLESTAYDFPVICVGNLSTGGTGKSPMIEFLIESLKENHKIAVLSRGYKRKSKGFLEVSKESNVEDVGDEPLQFKNKFPEITVAVCADRREGISLLKDKSDVILLDDAFQHRKVKASMNVLLTPYFDLYIDDFVLPTGNLREPKNGAKRADIVVVTKCPGNISVLKMNEIQWRLNLRPGQELYFSTIGYHAYIYGKNEKWVLESLKDKNFTLITGIANAKPLTDFLKKEGLVFEHREFLDHHHFTKNEIESFKVYDHILTTEKDYMRLKDNLNSETLFYLPIKTLFLNEGKMEFIGHIEKHIH